MSNAEVKMRYYLLDRDDEFQIVSCLEGSDPLHGYGSWNLTAGPFSEWGLVEVVTPWDHFDDTPNGIR